MFTDATVVPAARPLAPCRERFPVSQQAVRLAREKVAKALRVRLKGQRVGGNTPCFSASDRKAAFDQYAKET